MLKIDLIAAARPNFMKVAPIYHALARLGGCAVRLVHTGQHYDANMSAVFFRDLGLPEPDINLGIGGGTHAEQTGQTLMAYERICLADRPDWTVVVGDVNATLACALAAAKIGVRVGHVEAGLRSRDRAMPEEINRILTDAVADTLWTPSGDAGDNLVAEGIPETRIEFVGNVMIDTFELLRSRIDTSHLRADLGVTDERYTIITLHRPSNVDEDGRLALLTDEIIRLSRGFPVIFPVHPRTRTRLMSTGLLERLDGAAGVTLLEPLGYIDFMNLLTGAAIAITDSGGMQEETTYLGMPCLTIRDNTERPITISHGTNRLIRGDRLVEHVNEALDFFADRPRSGHEPPELWDGHAAERIVTSIINRS